LDGRHRVGLDPEDLFALGEELGYDVAISWLRSGTDGRFDVALLRSATEAGREVVAFPGVASPPRRWREYASDPLQVRAAERLVPRSRASRAELLPEHRVPAAFVALESPPVPPNGKLDRAAFPVPDARPYLDAPFVPPSSDVERAIAAAWREALQ